MGKNFSRNVANAFAGGPSGATAFASENGDADESLKGIPVVRENFEKMLINSYKAGKFAKVVVSSNRHKMLNVIKIMREISICQKYNDGIKENPYFLDFVECFSISNTGETDDADPAREKLFEMLKDELVDDGDTAFVVVTEFVKDVKTLDKMFTEAKGKYEPLHYVLCMQVLQALKQLHTWKIVHNDFHMDNVMVVPNENLTTYTFQRGNEEPSITCMSTHCIKVFDWDLAVTAETKDEEKLRRMANLAAGQKKAEIEHVLDRAKKFEDEEKRDLAAFFSFLAKAKIIDPAMEIAAANKRAKPDDEEIGFDDCFSHALKDAVVVQGLCNALFEENTYEEIWEKLYDAFYKKLQGTELECVRR